MNQFDATVMAWTNSFAAKSSVFDWFMALVQGNAVIKGAPPCDGLFLSMVSAGSGQVL